MGSADTHGRIAHGFYRVLSQLFASWALALPTFSGQVRCGGLGTRRLYAGEMRRRGRDEVEVDPAPGAVVEGDEREGSRLPENNKEKKTENVRDAETSAETTRGQAGALSGSTGRFPEFKDFRPTPPAPGHGTTAPTMPQCSVDAAQDPPQRRLDTVRKSRLNASRERRRRADGQAITATSTRNQLFYGGAGCAARLISNLGLCDRLPGSFLNTLDEDDKDICYRAALMCYSVTGSTQVPREMQLRVVLASQNGSDCLVSAATFPPHIRATVEKKLLQSGYTFIHTTSNRANTIYATHEVLNSIEHLQNYKCFLSSPFSLESQPRVLIFVDKKELACRIADHLDSCLPSGCQDKGIVRHYHSMMSQKYLEVVHKAFTTPSGNCRVLVATSGQSVGVDFPDVKIVCTAGLPGTMVDVLQRAGRALCNSNEDALFIVFYESWAHELSLDEYSEGDLGDPDRPRSTLKPSSQ
ncbi:P-loop containing nucleoside triphosphate hydrolase protein [Lactarius hengduanensis]|nr:P-loop containing nucleoside triphosphate hydrolase protein [Lactarius hengduanensis]